jgi:hypothetical protein
LELRWDYIRRELVNFGIVLGLVLESPKNEVGRDENKERMKQQKSAARCIHRRIFEPSKSIHFRVSAQSFLLI